MPTPLQTACLAWGLVAAAGFSYGIWYESTPTATQFAPRQWPADTACTLVDDRPTLLMFIHPRCPCSRASLNELAVLLTRCHRRVNAQVLFLKPSSEPDSWAQTDLWTTAQRIPGVVARWDVDGVEQQRFASRVSGEVVLYAPSGELLFHGGITAARGHAGDNRGRSTIEALLLGESISTDSTPVFGCPLVGTDAT